LADECIAAAVVAGLRRHGLDVLDAKDVCRGDDDERVLALAAAAGRTVITHDWGFGEMSIRQAKPATGIIILSLYAMPADVRERYAVDTLTEIACQSEGWLTIIEPGRVRRRPLTSP
jgi:predicted nuclease of predicted toxin-antitoxin system